MTGLRRRPVPRGLGCVAVTIVALAGVTRAAAQGTAADYERARSLKATYEQAAGAVAEPATWIEGSSRFWYRRAIAGGNEFVVSTPPRGRRHRPSIMAAWRPRCRWRPVDRTPR
jgi:DNA-binding GntR family transcriptional regulator